MATTETLDVISRRYSCRAYSDKAVPADVLDAIMTAGLHSPSAMNRQPWRLIAVSDPAVLGQIDEVGMAYAKEHDPAAYDRMMGRGGTLTYKAPVVVVIAGQELESQWSPDLDCGIVASHLVVAAASLGVDSCIVAMTRPAFQDRALCRQIGMPDGFRFVLSVLLGYAAGEPQPGHAIDQSKAIIV